MISRIQEDKTGIKVSIENMRKEKKGGHRTFRFARIFGRLSFPKKLAFAIGCVGTPVAAMLRYELKIGCTFGGCPAPGDW